MFVFCLFYSETEQQRDSAAIQVFLFIHFNVDKKGETKQMIFSWLSGIAICRLCSLVMGDANGCNGPFYIIHFSFSFDFFSTVIQNEKQLSCSKLAKKGICLTYSA